MTGSPEVPLPSDNLGGVFFPGDFSGALVYASPTYGFALANHFVVGGTLTAALAISDGGSGALAISPYVRYYVIDREDVGVYGQVSTGVLYGDSEVYGFNSVSLSAGLQIPLVTGIRFGPSLTYGVATDEGQNSLNLAARFELVLGRNNRPEAPAIAGIRRGTIMLGSQFVSATFQKDITSGGLSVGGHYFLTDRLAASASLGLQRTRADFSQQNITASGTDGSYSFGLGGRYYLTTARHLVWFTDVGVGYQTNRSNFEVNNDPITSTSNAFRLGVGAGGQLFVRDNVALEFGPQWNRLFQDGFGASIITLSVGARFLL